MKTENIHNFEFIDGTISMHVRATKYISGKSVVYRVSYSNTMRAIPYTVEGSVARDDIEAIAKAKLTQCYADMASYLQQVM